PIILIIMESSSKPNSNEKIDLELERNAALSFAGRKKVFFDLLKRKQVYNGKQIFCYYCKYPGCDVVLTLTPVDDNKIHVQQLDIHRHPIPEYNWHKRTRYIPNHPYVFDQVSVSTDGLTVAISACQRLNPLLPSHISRIESGRTAAVLADGRFRLASSDIVLVCNEQAMLAKEESVRNAVRNNTPEQAFRLLFDDLVDVTDETVFLLLSKETPMACTSTSLPTSILAGWSTRLGAAILQVDNQERISSIRSNYQNLITLDTKIASRIKRFDSDRRQFLMTGHCLILTDQKAVSPGYAAAVRFEHEAEFHPGLLSDLLGRIADDVWAEVLAKIPELAAFSSCVISDKTRGYTIGKTLFNIMSLTKNLKVPLHTDINDAHWTLVIWMHGGVGPILNGWFGIPALGLRFLPTTMTVAVFNAAALTHGTTECSIPVGTSACRFGSSHFLRMPDLANLVCLRLGAQSSGINLQELKEMAASARLKSAKDEVSALRAELIAAGKAEMLNGSVEAWKDPAVQWRAWS
ncbi:hypothetical protein Vretimale_18400, partial [Volvox reticuliferus]